MYGWLKEKFSEEMSRSQTGSGNSQYGKIWISNIKEKKSIKVYKSKLEFYSELGWVKGRNVWIKEEKDIVRTKELKLKNIEKCHSKLKKIEESISIYQDFLDTNYKSLTSYSKSLGVSTPGLTKKLKKYLPNYNNIFIQGKNYNKKLLSIKDLKICRLY